MNFIKKIKMPLQKMMEDSMPQQFFGKSFFSQTGEDMILAHLFDDRLNGFFIDVGAHHPIKYSNTYYFYRKGWRGINIDPTPGSMRLFNRFRPLDTNIELAIHTIPGEIEMNLYNEGALNTLSEKTVQQRQVKGRWHPVGTCKVQCQPLASVLEKYWPPGRPIDFLTVDVEGLEMAVLKSNDWVRFRPRVVLVEEIERADSGAAALIGEFLVGLNYTKIAATLVTTFYQLRDLNH